jgi:hypothetical protein
MTTQAQLREEFLSRSENGVLQSSAWTTGSGKWTKMRALPEGVSKVSYPRLSDDPRVVAYLQKWPRTRRALVIDEAAQ